MSRFQYRPCPVCEKPYRFDTVRLSRYRRGSTCSRACSYKFRVAPPRLVIVSCATCGKDFARYPSNARKKFCSRDCHYGGRSLGLSKRPTGLQYTLINTPQRTANLRAGALKTVAKRRANGSYKPSDQTREKIRQATIKSLANRPQFSSRAEDRVAATLDEMGIAYERWRKIRGVGGRYVGIIDFWLIEEGVALEFNGTFWHSDPRAYPNGPVHQSQIRSDATWNRKVSALKSSNIPLCVVWEMDYTEDPIGSIRKSLSAR